MDELEEVSRVLCDRKLSAKVKGKMYKSVVRQAMLYRMENSGSDGKTGGKNGSCRIENGEMDTRSNKKGQDKKRICERDRENARLCWYGHVKRREDYVGKGMMGGVRHKEKRKAKEKVEGFGERKHGKGWS